MKDGVRLWLLAKAKRELGAIEGDLPELTRLVDHYRELMNSGYVVCEIASKKLWGGDYREALADRRAWRRETEMLRAVVEELSKP